MVNLLNSASPLASATRTGGEVYREVLWCLTNIASGQYEHTKLVLPAVPRLLQFLENGGTLAEHSAWVLGNIAADCEEFRQHLIASGAVRPLVQQLHNSTSAAPGLAKTCAWALSNLARGHETSAAPFIDAGIVPVLAAGLEQNTPRSFNEATVVEVAWLLSFLTAREEECLKLLLENGVVEWLLPYFATTNELLLTPILRVFGNVCCGSLDHHTDEWQMPYVERLLRADSPFLSKLHEFLHAGTVAASSDANAPASNVYQAAESAWVLSNLAALDARVVERIVQAQFLPLLAHHFHNGAFEVKREVAFALANVALTSAELLEQVLALDVLPGFLRLLTVADVAVVGNSLRFIENVLRVAPRGDALVESLEGIDALENVQFQSNEEHLSRWAAALVNEFYGENYGVNSPPSAADIGAGFSADTSDVTFSFGSTDAPAGAGGRGRGAHMTTPAWKK